jgi:hypothetical protein
MVPNCKALWSLDWESTCYPSGKCNWWFARGKLRKMHRDEWSSSTTSWRTSWTVSLEWSRTWMVVTFIYRQANCFFIKNHWNLERSLYIVTIELFTEIVTESATSSPIGLPWPPIWKLAPFPMKRERRKSPIWSGADAFQSLRGSQDLSTQPAKINIFS